MANSNRLLYWAPRILCIVAILFVSMFALDSFSPELSIVQQIQAFLIHLIPSYILIALLVVAWKWEYIGGILMSVIGLAFSVFVFVMNFQRTHHNFWTSAFITLIVAIPFIVVGLLFILNSKRHNSKT